MTCFEVKYIGPFCFSTVFPIVEKPSVYKAL